LQEHVNEKTVALSVKGAKLTGRLLAKAMRAFLNQARASPKAKGGRVSMKSLTKDGASLANTEAPEVNLKAFDRIARRCKVKYYPHFNGANNTWTFFFKAKDGANIDAAFKEYARQTLTQKSRKSSLMDRLAKFRDLARQVAPPARNKNRGEREH
jgi:hypothetical protein